jgi:hypothetical protein
MGLLNQSLQLPYLLLLLIQLALLRFHQAREPLNRMFNKGLTRG